MLPFARPTRHRNHDNEAGRLLKRLREAIAADGLRDLSKKTEKYPMWQAGWEPRAEGWLPEYGDREHGIYKKTLIGAAHLQEYAKCLWCERLLGWKGEFVVDHFRPKAVVTTWAGAPPEVADAPPPHVGERTGYWWLAFDWDNWLLACFACNSTWKLTRFPCAGALLHTWEGVERVDAPLLLDPASDFCPRDHFRWDEFGYVRGVSDVGAATIITCGLNRADLRKARFTKIGDVLAELGRFRDALARRAEFDARASARRLATFGHERAEFAGMVRQIIEDDLERAWEELDLGEALP